jgi:alkanesulfonate monooxygenase SsuD/methylene tetrahydromethanopterin reductase-like flavin-dependent oxidoreductase (luciferase family)
VSAPKRLTFGVMASPDADLIAELTDLGFDSLWVGGHILSPRGAPEAIQALARMVALTKDVTVGTAVLLLPLYPPLLVAKQLADLDVASGGRLAVGIGVGGEVPAEFDAMGIPMSERGRRMDESIRMLRSLWRGGELKPAPVQAGGPPIVVAGRSAAAVRRAALRGDGWMPYLYSPRRYAESVATVRDLAAAEQRPLDDFRWSAWLVACVRDDEEAAIAGADALMPGGYRPEYGSMSTRVAVAGTPEQVTARLCEYVDAGARHFVFHAGAGVGGMETPRRLAREVLPAVRQHFG